MFTINCRGQLLILHPPVVMGILNITPDSFYRHSRLQREDEWLQRAAQMLEEGAAILDIGGQSTRPGSKSIGPTEEMERVLPAITAIHKAFPEAVISVDTYHHAVAKAAVEAGASLVNDISAGNLDPEMISTVASLQVPYIAMHMKGTPATMQQWAQYDDPVTEVLDYFVDIVQACKNAGIRDIIIDPGFGFAKNPKQNFALLKNLEVLHALELPLLVGVSRKSMIWKTLGTSPEESLNGSTVLHTLALQKGAHILRVHDVKEAVEVAKLYMAYQDAE